MITLITGIPGMGKTALLVSMLSEYVQAAERPLFVMGIPDLQLEHIVAPTVAEWTEYRQSPEDASLQLAYFTFPPNSILIIDEAQRVFRPRSSVSKVPPEVAALETHRHTGLDIILLTQKPKLIDMNVRELVGRHIHIRAGLVGRYLYEWPHIADGESRIDRGDAAKRKFSPPKASFKSYKSAEVHTKHKFRIHQGYYFLIAAFGFLAYHAYNAMQIFERHNLNAAPVPTLSAPSVAAGGVTRSSADSQPAATTTVEQFTRPSTSLAHPFEGHKFIIRATIASARKAIAYLEIVSPVGDVVPMTSMQLIDAGYIYVQVAPCLAVLKFHDAEITAVCSAKEGAPPIVHPPFPTTTPVLAG